MEAQEFFQTSFCPQFPSSDNTTTTNVNASAADHFIVEDLFDFSNDDAANITDPTFDSLPANSTDDSPPLDTTTPNSNFLVDISCRNTADGHFSSDLSVPYDDLAELEWLSKFAEESFSSKDLQKLQLISGIKAPNDAASQTREEPNPVFNPQVSVPAKARSNWTSRLLVLSPTTTSSSHSDTVAPPKKPAPRRRDATDGGDGRKCLHCALSAFFSHILLGFGFLFSGQRLSNTTPWHLIMIVVVASLMNKPQHHMLAFNFMVKLCIYL